MQKNCFLISRAFDSTTYNVSSNQVFICSSIFFFSAHFCVMRKLAARTGCISLFHFTIPFAFRTIRKPYAKTKIVLADGPTMTSQNIYIFFCSSSSSNRCCCCVINSTYALCNLYLDQSKYFNFHFAACICYVSMQCGILRRECFAEPFTIMCCHGSFVRFVNKTKNNTKEEDKSKKR